MEPLHTLLKRQFKRHFGENFTVPLEWQRFVAAVNAAYREFDDDREMLERSLELSSQELLQANSQTRALFQAIPDLLFRLDHTGTILDFKSGATGDLLLHPRELFGKRIQDVPIKQVGDQFREAIQRVTSENSLVSIEYSLPLQGQKHFYEARLVPLPQNEIVVIVRNITERKKAEEARSQAEAKYRSIFEDATEGIFQTTPEGKFLTANPAIARILRFDSPEELIATRTDIARQGYVDPERREEFARLMAEKGFVSGFEYEVYRKDGSKVWISETARAICDDHGKVICYEGTFEDISERKKAEALRNGQYQVLEMIATGASLASTLESLMRLIESQSDGMLCSVLLVDEEGKRLRHGAAPSLPADYNKLVDGLCIGPNAGSCGTAAYFGKPVIVSDIQTDSLWEGVRETAARHALRACWFTPIFSHRNRVLGTFAMYYREVRNPSPAETRLIEIATQIAGIAIERKRTEDSLRHNEAHMALAQQIAHFGSWELDLENLQDINANRLYWSDETFRIFGFEPGSVEVTNELFFSAVHPADRTAIAQAVAKALEEKIHYSIDHRIVLPDGKIRHVHEEAQIIVDEMTGRPLKMAGAVLDITERKRTEEALFESQTLYHSFVEHLPAGVFRKGQEGRYVFVNSLFCRLKGLKAEEILGKTPQELAEYEQTFQKAKASEPARQRTQTQGADHHQQMIETGKPIELEEVYPQPNGTAEYFQVIKSPVFGPDGRVIGTQGIQFDITERRRLEAQLRQAQKMDAFGQLAAGVAHDFNNLLTVIQGNLSLIRMGELSEAEQNSALDEVHRASERAANLTRQLLTFSRRQPVQPKQLDLNDVVANMTRMLQRLIGEHIALEARYAPGGAHIHADPGMMEQALVNLAVNSRDAMPKGGNLVVQTAIVTLDVAKTQASPRAKPGEYVRLSVTDSGSGIAPEHLPHIFEPFFTTKEVGKGTGLGLATVFGIVEQHSGWIEVESCVGVGTTFHIYLPRLPKGAMPESNPNPWLDIRGGNETILLVEDESAVRELMRQQLERFGYRVHTAPSGVAALNVWQQHRADVDLLVTDMVMPEGVNGRELAERLRAEKPDLKVVYCSGYTDEVLGDNSPLRNNPNFLEKPFDPRTFLHRVRDCLDGR